MEFYYNFTILVSLLGIIGTLNENLLNKRGFLSKKTISYFSLNLFFVLGISLIFFSTYRTCGTDLPSYQSHFNEISFHRIFDYSIDKGYSAFVAFVKSFFITDFQSYLFVESLLYNSLFLLTIYRFRSKINLFLSLLAYVTLLYYTGFNILRIVLASSIVFYASIYLFSENNIKYVILILIASTIHVSAIVAFLPLLIVKLSKSSFSRVTLLTCVCGFILYYFVSKIEYFIPILSERYLSYIEDITSDSTIGFGTLLMNLPYLVAIFVLYKENCDRTFLLIMYATSLCSFIFSLLGYYSSIFSRMYIIFSLPYLILLPFLVNKVKNRQMKTLIFFMVLLYYLWRFNSYLSINVFSDGNVPYTISI